VTIVTPNKALIGGEGEEYGGDVLIPGDVPHAVGWKMNNQMVKH